MSRRRSRSPSPGNASHPCNSSNPRDLERRIFVGNLPSSEMDKKDLEEMFRQYGKILGVSLLRGFGFVQFERVEEAEAAKAGHKGRIFKGYKIDVNMAVERRNQKAQPQQSPPRRPLFSSYGDREPRPRSRSPNYSRDGRREGREPRDSRDARDSRDSFRGSETRDREDYDRHFRGGAPDDFFRRKEDAFRDFREPRNGRRELEEETVRPEERRRNELYRQYYEELQRRQDSERPVDCSVIVVNKAQNREYAETVGRKVRDLGMVVDLIFLNTEVSLTQALEDVGRSRTPFAIIITQQHQVHRSCTVNILFGTPQEHRNMPMQDAMMLIAHNFDTYKVESRDKEREEIAKKAAKMADDVLLRDPDRDNHPVSALTAITLLYENRFVTAEELDILIAYLKDKRARLGRPAVDSLPATLPPPAAGQPPPSRSLSSAPGAPPASSNQQELQAKILSLFTNSGSAASASAPPVGAVTPQRYSALAPSPHSAPSQNPPGPHSGMPHPSVAQGYGPPPGRMPLPVHRPPNPSAGINFDSPSVQKALDTLIQSGPSLNHLVGAGTPQHPPPRPGPGMGQAPPPMSMYPRPY
ncbi:nuclear receptor coactivator 5 isoform X2 [Eucyclogobius newberryi]|uniref:nuclear receptor coactivator 5 isoform X2 n=1 Tax=Eucyclogobius newberryi TaxID=166745 RepID=UPI003B595C27